MIINFKYVKITNHQLLDALKLGIGSLFRYIYVVEQILLDVEPVNSIKRFNKFVIQVKIINL